MAKHVHNPESHGPEALTGNIDHVGDGRMIGNVGPGKPQPQTSIVSDTRDLGYGNKGNDK